MKEKTKEKDKEKNASLNKQLTKDVPVKKYFLTTYYVLFRRRIRCLWSLVIKPFSRNLPNRSHSQVSKRKTEPRTDSVQNCCFFLKKKRISFYISPKTGWEREPINRKITKACFFSFLPEEYFLSSVFCGTCIFSVFRRFQIMGSTLFVWYMSG